MNVFVQPAAQSTKLSIRKRILQRTQRTLGGSV
jgi:hypothetical protein